MLEINLSFKVFDDIFTRFEYNQKKFSNLSECRNISCRHQSLHIVILVIFLPQNSHRPGEIKMTQ